MTWLDEVVADGFDDPAGVIEDITSEQVAVGSETAGKITLAFRVRDMRGDKHVATADVLLPIAFADATSRRLPAWFGCGYEVEEPAAERHLRYGRAVFSHRHQPDDVFPSPHALLRGPTTDYVLAHLARGARFVDPTQIAYGGGSAGGYATLMTVAEAFPAAVATALAPPVNLGYEFAYMNTVFPRYVADPPTGHPIIQTITTAFMGFLPPARAAYGEDFGSAGFLGHSPVAHVDRVTCPVFVMTSTADFLVPVEQFSREFAEATLAAPPEHVTIAAEDVHPSPAVAVRLLDVLGDRADVRRVPLPDGAELQKGLDLTFQQPKRLVEMASAPSPGRQWLVNVLDEGPIVLGATHGLYAVEADTEPFIRTALSRGIGVEQLTATKLDQLIDRYRGAEWVAPGFSHLDEPAAEQADVLRGLRLYCAQSDAHAQRFADLYTAVDETARVLPDITG